jgi:ligand-binding sensor domain-containing protein
MKQLLLLTFPLILLSGRIAAQEYSYTHYDISDGLAGSTVYCITQDKDGFIWTGTETGVSRFDGTHFYNYTTVDGLPDVEILEMFGDSKGRVWMAPFRKSICYYYKGKIYNQENDSLLGRFRLRDNIIRFAEDKAGNVLIQEKAALQLVMADGALREYDSIGSRPIRNCGAISRSIDGHFLVQIDQEVYQFSGGRFTPFCPISIASSSPGYICVNSRGMIWRVDSNLTAVRSFVTGKISSFPFEWIHYRHLSFTSVSDSLFYINEFSGAKEYNPSTGSTRLFLPGKQVSRTFRDATGNTWFTTLGQGIYRLNSDEFRTIRLNAPGMEASSVYAINRIDNRLLVGDNHNYVFNFSLPDMSLRSGFSGTGISKNRVLSFGRLSNGCYLVASDDELDEVIKDDFHRKRWYATGLKSVFPKNRDELLLSTYWGVALFNLGTFTVADTLWRERSTTVYYRRDTILIGTLNGLYALPPDRSVVFMGKKNPFFQKRISALAESADGTLWVASYDAGIVGYKDGRMIAALTKQQGLTSDICRTLLIHNNDLWIGTDKGLNRVRLDQPGYPIAQYTSQDGLGSDIVNAIYADSSVVYVGTPAGLSFFDETKIDLSEGCRLYLLSIFNSGKERIGDTSALLLPYTDKHIRLEFAGISYRSVGGITYRYRLMGLDSTWRTSKEAFLEYPTLPSGNYELQLQAVNKFGVSSSVLSLHFGVITPFWQATWFYALIIVIFLSLTWLFVSLRIRQIRRRQQEKERLSQRMMEMEHMALQAQMNPHFIFNCLNSIQQYIFDQDIFAANKYISGFAKLIRATLQNSSKSFIPLPDEISYLSGYLSLEKLRFKEKMDYIIEVDPAVNDDTYIIPPMLIQPYVENSMRHGLRHKLEGKGYIHIKFSKKGDRLSVTVEDNGIGRKKAAGFKTREHIEYQSKGMSLTADRIRMMNAKYNDSILIDVIDLEDITGQSTGTRVIMEFPLFHILLEKKLYDQDSFS